MRKRTVTPTSPTTLMTAGAGRVLTARTGKAHTSNHCPYGYKKDTLDSTHWGTDEEAAEVVRRIFRLCIAGKGPYDIARILHNEKIERPSYYMGKRGLGTHCTTYDTENPYMWQIRLQLSSPNPNTWGIR